MSIPLTKITATQNEVALSYYRARRLYFLAVVFVATIVINLLCVCASIRHCLQNAGNPTALLMSALMMLRHMDLGKYADKIEEATLETLKVTAYTISSILHSA